ncbi:uncharacterized protein ISCGN_012399 [Ixodes scapularis]
MPPTPKIPTAEKGATDYTSTDGVASEAKTSATTVNESVDGNLTSYDVAVEGSSADENRGDTMVDDTMNAAVDTDENETSYAVSVEESAPDENTRDMIDNTVNAAADIDNAVNEDGTEIITNTTAASVAICDSSMADDATDMDGTETFATNLPTDYTIVELVPITELRRLEEQAASQAQVIKNLQIQLNRCKDQLTQAEDTLHHAQAELQAALAKCSSLEKHEAELKETKHALCKCRRELELALQQCKTLEAKSSRRFCIDCFKDSPADVLFYTGLPSHDHFMRLLRFLDPGEDGENVKVWSTTYSDKARKAGRRSILSPAEQFFLLLVRLRLGLFERDLAYRFRVSKATVSKVCITWISYVYLHLGQLHLWLPREAVDDAMPPAFKDRYPTTRVILDATEVKCEASSSLVLQSATFSPYKSTNTFKGLIGISPDGTVTFISELFTGSMSDKECVEKSGFLKLPFDDGDSVMADKGFRIEEMLKKINVRLNIPPFLRKGYFTTEEVKETEQIASLRIHVERRIQRIKNFHIFDRPVQISLAPVVSEMWAICVALTNFQSPLMKASDD